MNSIILYLINISQEQYKQICYLILFICEYIPLKQWAFDDSHSSKYQKFKVDKLHTVYTPATFDYQLYIAYIEHRNVYLIKPVKRRSEADIPKDLVCPRCGVSHDYLYKNNGSKDQFLCKVCEERFNTDNIYKHTIELRCPYCGNILVPTKKRKCFRIHKCINPKCSYYLANKRKLPPDLKSEDKHKYNLHYIYREFTMDFFRMDLYSLPPSATGFCFKRFSPHILGLVLTYHVNLKLSTRQTSHALKEVHGIDISHTTVATYAMTAASVIKPFVDSYDYKPSNILSADETYIKKIGKKYYIWIIMDANQVSDNRSVGPCILAMRMAFEKFKVFPSKVLKFIADGYSAYPLVAQYIKAQKGWDFDISQVIGLTNDDVVSLWVAYHNFLRPHPHNYWKPFNEIDEFEKIGKMPANGLFSSDLGNRKSLKCRRLLLHSRVPVPRLLSRR